MKLLHIDSSITGTDSVSRTLTASIVATLTAADPAIAVTTRDLAAAPLPHLDLAAYATLGDNDALAEFLAADVVVIGAPMYNFTIPSQLKGWIDRILVPGATFAYGENGPQGLAGGKRVIVAISRGGFYGAGAAWESLEHLETYLTGVFEFIGIMPEYVVAEGLKVSPEQKTAAIDGAHATITRLAA